MSADASNSIPPRLTIGIAGAAVLGAGALLTAIDLAHPAVVGPIELASVQSQLVAPAITAARQVEIGRAHV